MLAGPRPRRETDRCGPAGTARIIGGTYAVTATVGAPGISSKKVPISAPRPFTGNHVAFTSPVDLTQLGALAAGITSATGADAGQIRDGDAVDSRRDGERHQSRVERPVLDGG